MTEQRTPSIGQSNPARLLRGFTGVDWSRAPDLAKAWAVQPSGRAYWYLEQPHESRGPEGGWVGSVIREAPLFGWDESLAAERGWDDSLTPRPLESKIALQEKQAREGEDPGPDFVAPKISWLQAPATAAAWGMDAEGRAWWYEGPLDVGNASDDLMQAARIQAPDFGFPTRWWAISLTPRPFSILAAPASPDPVNHPSHYTEGPIECIEVLEQLARSGHDFRILNAMKYLWRYRQKGGLESLRKSVWYIQRAIDDAQDRRK